MENTSKKSALSFFTNKYFVLALILAIIVLVYLYFRKKTCSIEGMQNVDLSTLSQNMAEKPWTDDVNSSGYKTVGNNFDIRADNNSKFGKNKLSRKDQLYHKYINDENKYINEDDENKYINDDYKNKKIHNKNIKKKTTKNTQKKRSKQVKKLKNDDTINQAINGAINGVINGMIIPGPNDTMTRSDLGVYLPDNYSKKKYTRRQKSPDSTSSDSITNSDSNSSSSSKD